MNLRNQLKVIENRMKYTTQDSKVHFFNSHEEYMTAYNKNLINKKDIVFIDDI